MVSGTLYCWASANLWDRKGFSAEPKVPQEWWCLKELQKFKLAINWSPGVPGRYREVPHASFSHFGEHWTSLANTFKTFPHQKILFTDTKNKPFFPPLLLHPQESEVSKKNAAFLGIICMSELFASLSERLYSWLVFHLPKLTAPTKDFTSSLVSPMLVPLTPVIPSTHNSTHPPQATLPLQPHLGTCSQRNRSFPLSLES